MGQELTPLCFGLFLGSSDIKAMLTYYFAQYQDETVDTAFTAGRCEYDIQQHPQYANTSDCWGKKKNGYCLVCAYFFLSFFLFLCCYLGLLSSAFFSSFFPFFLLLFFLPFFMLLSSSYCSLDINAGTFHILLANVLTNSSAFGFVADIDRSIQVWNQPIFKFESELTGATRNASNVSAKGNEQENFSTDMTKGVSFLS